MYFSLYGYTELDSLLINAFDQFEALEGHCAKLNIYCDRLTMTLTDACVNGDNSLWSRPTLSLLWFVLKCNSERESHSS